MARGLRWRCRFLLLHLLCWGHWWLIPWLLWWVKPLLDRAPLHLLSQALFGEPPDQPQLRRELPRLLLRQIVAALTWRRFDLARSFTLSVSQLEGLTGKARRQRLRDLGQPGRGPAVWLTVVCVHLELACDFALLTLVWLLIPDFVDLEFSDLLDDSSEWGQVWLNVVSFCGMSLIEPGYVAAGFALYLNRRTALEAWDLELGFRRLAARLTGSGRAGMGLAMLLVGLSVLTIPVDGLTTDADSSLCEQRRARETELAQSASPVQRALAETLREPELQVCEVQQRWQWRENNAPEPPPEPRFHLHGLAQWFAVIVETLLWVGFGLVIVIIGWWMVRRGPRTLAGIRRRSARPPVLPIQGRSETLAAPAADLADRAWQLWSAGQSREALRLLYQGSLAGLAIHYRLPTPTSATEDECLHLAAIHLADPDLLDFFRRLTRAWQAAAYAHRPPDPAMAQALCQQWPRYFVAANTGPA